MSTPSFPKAIVEVYMQELVKAHRLKPAVVQARSWIAVGVYTRKYNRLGCSTAQCIKASKADIALPQAKGWCWPTADGQGTPAERLLNEILANRPDILEDPDPTVIFEDFGDSALIFDSFIHRLKGLIRKKPAPRYTSTMCKLMDRGYQIALDRYRWGKAPPSFAVSN